jgi:GNAT superfamily N-acetyltransferase
MVNRRKSVTPLTRHDLEVHPLTLDRWDDLETLFGKSGAYSGCWCMWWRISRNEFTQQSGQGNRLALKQFVTQGIVPGLIAYVDKIPAAWCSLAQREQYPSLERSRTLKRIDDRPVWSLVCFFVARAWRGRGILLPLVEHALTYAAQNGAKIVEAYPIEAEGDRKIAPVSSFMGLASIFRQAGFIEVARPSPKRPVMRYLIEEPHD